MGHEWLICLNLRYKNVWEMMSRLDYHFGEFVSAYVWINNRGHILEVARLEKIVIGYFSCWIQLWININISAVLGSKFNKKSSNMTNIIWDIDYVT